LIKRDEAQAVKEDGKLHTINTPVKKKNHFQSQSKTHFSRTKNTNSFNSKPAKKDQTHAQLGQNLQFPTLANSINPQSQIGLIP